MSDSKGRKTKYLKLTERPIWESDWGFCAERAEGRGDNQGKDGGAITEMET